MELMTKTEASLSFPSYAYFPSKIASWRVVVHNKDDIIKVEGNIVEFFFLPIYCIDHNLHVWDVFN